ncbi:hypothetical protein DRF62_12030 [Chryseobacterium piscium]|uniref:Uncharacterized protein n=1 Tax=Chryseobacterium piscium TaxID=333702 RepID=A0A3D9BJU0_9FLAO|nr:hypothetical protein DRF62_12030 [Chryseobacterium piscium]
MKNYYKPLLNEIEDSTKSNAFANEKYFQTFKKIFAHFAFKKRLLLKTYNHIFKQKFVNCNYKKV